MITNPIEAAARRPTDMTFAAYTGCVALDVQALMSTWTTPMKTECIGTIGNVFFGFAATNRVYTCLNWLCEALVAIFVLIMVIALFKSGAKHVGHGRYIAFTWRVENSLPHRICSVTLIVFCVLMLGDFVRFVVAQYTWKALLWIKCHSSRQSYRHLEGLSELLRLCTSQQAFPTLIGEVRAFWSCTYTESLPR